MAIDIEVVATSAVKKIIAKTDYLMPFIADKDREPLWDGYIYAYGDKTKSNSSNIRRAPVQVKGKIVENLDKIKNTYSVSVSSLKGYCQDGGVIYFVVLMDGNGENEIVLYANLLPYVINNYIKGIKKGQKTASIHLQKFPIEKNEVENLVFNFLRDMDRQVLLRKGDNISLEDLSDSIDLSQIDLNFSFTAIGYEDVDVNPFSYLSKHDTYCYAYLPKLNAYTVIEHIEKWDEARKEVECEISVNGKVYYNVIMQIQKREERILQIGSCIKFIDVKDGRNTIKFSINGSLNEMILGSELIIDMISAKGIELDGKKIQLDLNEDQLEKIDLKSIKGKLNYLKLVKKMLDSLGVKEDFECENITEKEEQYIEMLIRAFLYNQTIGFETDEKIQPVVTLRICNLVLILDFKEQPDGKYVISDFFDKDTECSAEGVDGKLFPTSKYTIIKAEDFCKISNYDYEKARKSLFAIENPGHLERVNMHMLEMIKAFDSSNNSIFLDEAERIAVWLCEKNKSDMYIVNLLQICKRRGQLSDENIDKLLELEERNRDNLQMMLGINILLENYKFVEMKLKKLVGAKKEAFESYPIYTLWKERQKV